ncbi:hypothetical protein JGG40_23790 [Salmonella enterica subsp. enterica serovar Derby]|nr:hypothetical protein [Salmonella enterica subsp. enterica serovar Derby]
MDEWIVRAVIVRAQTVVRTTYGNSESFDVKVGLHQGSVLSPLLFVIVMDVITKEVREGLPWEVLYADDLVLAAESKEKLKVRVQKWKASLETKGLRVNVGKTKIMVGGEGPRRVEEMGKWRCGVCRKGVGRNSLQCTNCLKWVHKRCSQMKGKLATASLTFICAKCTGQVADCDKGDERFDIGNGVSLEKVERFCYLGDMVSADGGADLAVTARVRSAWKKFMELGPILTSKGASMHLKGKIYQSCVRNFMMCGS